MSRKNSASLKSRFHNIFWDFDGVIHDSLQIKADGFVSLFPEIDIESKKYIEKYHFENGGVDRFEKIKHFYHKFNGHEITNKKLNRLAENFSDNIKEKIFQSKYLIDESVSFIKSNFKNFDFHIVSASEHNELLKICENFKISDYFISINGSPGKKADHLRRLIMKFDYQLDESAMIGDSFNDYEASLENNISFFAFNNPKLKHLNYLNVIEDLLGK